MTDQERPNKNTADSPMGEEEQAYTSAAIRGSFWGIVQTVLSNGFKQIVFLILAWIVLPSDFGLFGIALATVTICMICSPLPLTDLLVQRRERMGRAIPNLMRIATIGALLMVPLIGGAAWLEGARHGQSIRVEGGGTASDSTPLHDLDCTPPLQKMVADADGSFEVNISGDWIELRLPQITDDTITLATYAGRLQQEVDTAVGSKAVLVELDGSGRLVIHDGDGTTVPIRTWSSAEGSVLYVLGFEYRSITLTVLLLLFSLLPLVLLFKLPLEPLLRLQLRFKEIAAAYFLGTVTSGIFAIILGFLGIGAVALLMNQIMLPLIAAVIMAMLVGKRTRIPKSEREAARPLFRDSLMLWCAQWVHTGGNMFPLFMLSFFHPSEEIGYYVFALSVSVQIITLLSQNLGHAFTPIFSRIQDDPERLASAYMRSVGAITGLTMPAMLLTGALAPVFFPMIFPEKLLPAIPLLMVLLLSQSFASSTSASQALLKGSGRNRAWLLWQSIQNALFIPPIILVAQGGSVLDMAMLVLGMQIIAGPLGVLISGNGHASLLQILKVHWVPIIGCIPLFISGYVSMRIGPSWPALLVWCPCATLFSAGFYILILRVLDRQRHDEFMTLVRGVVAKLRRRGA